MKKLTGWLLLVTMVRTVAVATAGAASCPGDLDGNNAVTVDELIQAVNGALSGCPAALTLAHAYDGEAAAIRSQCANPADNDTFAFEVATVLIDEQHGSQFSGALNGVDDEGEPVSIHVEGSVDAQGFVNGRVWDDDGDITGTIRAVVAGDGLALAASVFEPNQNCSVAFSLLAERRR